MAAPVILIVEDEPLVLAMLARVLQGAGYEVLEAVNGTEALNHARHCQSQIDIVVCDVILPDGAGPDVVVLLKQFCPHVKTIFTSGYPLDILTERAAFDHAILDDNNFFLPKPFLPRELVNQVDGILWPKPKRSITRTAQLGAALVRAAHS